MGQFNDSVLVENTNMSVKSTHYAEASTSSVETVVTIPYTIAGLDLGGGTVVSSIKTICQLDDLHMKPLQKEHLETGLN